jgi:predicted amidohydrolase YtcJ
MGSAFSRRALIRAAATAAAAMAGARIATAAGQSAPATVTQAIDGEMALVNGRFVDGRGMVGSSVVVRNGRLASVGKAVPLAPWARTIDLGVRTVIPGLFDAHVHYTRAAVNPGYEARRIERAFSIRELQETIARRAAGVPAGACITCIGGWNHTQFTENRRPTKAELDAAAPAHAVSATNRRSSGGWPRS